jgi:hypothetical protein
MINSVSQSAGVSHWRQHDTPRTPPPPKPKEHEKPDSVQLSRQAQKAADADRGRDKH